MNLLTATRTGQGTRSDDLCDAVEGELVLIPDLLECDRQDPTSPFPRSFCGLWSGELTTTALTRQVPLTVGDLVLALLAAAHHVLVRRERWGQERWGQDRVLLEWAHAEAAFLRDVAAGYPPGTVLERSFTSVRPRGPAPPRPGADR